MQAPRNAPSTNTALSTTVVGLNFFGESPTATAAVAGFTCATTSWSTSTALVCLLQSSGGSSGTTSVVLDTVRGSAMQVVAIRMLDTEL